jgi:hypothetical protein
MRSALAMRLLTLRVRVESTTPALVRGSGQRPIQLVKWPALGTAESRGPTSRKSPYTGAASGWIIGRVRVIFFLRGLACRERIGLDRSGLRERGERDERDERQGAGYGPGGRDRRVFQSGWAGTACPHQEMAPGAGNQTNERARKSTRDTTVLTAVPPCTLQEADPPPPAQPFLTLRPRPQGPGRRPGEAAHECVQATEGHPWFRPDLVHS